jgi:flagellar protein FliO/FliZ
LDKSILDGTSASVFLAGLKIAGVLCLLLAVIFLGFYLLRRFGSKAGLTFAPQSELKLLGRLNLGPKKSLVLVRFLNKDLLIGVTDSHISLLSEIEADDAQTHTDDFATELSRHHPGGPSASGPSGGTGP